MYDLAVGDDVYLGDDGFGDDEMEGDGFGDDTLLVMGGPAARRNPRAAAQNRIRLQRIQPNKQVQVCSFPQGPNGSTTVTAGTTATLTARPQRPFQTERFVVPSTLSPFFAIVDLVVGRESMFINSEPAAAEIFSQTGVHVSLMGYIARPGIDITLSVTNIDGADHPFYGSIIGPALT